MLNSQMNMPQTSTELYEPTNSNSWCWAHQKTPMTAKLRAKAEQPGSIVDRCRCAGPRVPIELAESTSGRTSKVMAMATTASLKLTSR